MVALWLNSNKIFIKLNSWNNNLRLPKEYIGHKRLLSKLEHSIFTSKKVIMLNNETFSNNLWLYRIGLKIKFLVQDFL